MAIDLKAFPILGRQGVSLPRTFTYDCQWIKFLQYLSSTQAEQLTTPETRCDGENRKKSVEPVCARYVENVPPLRHSIEPFRAAFSGSRLPPGSVMS